MEFGPLTFALAFAAGVLSTLSPCVVPLLPILVASALAQHRLGLWSLAAGLALSFTALGLFVATIGVSIGIDSTLLHRAGGAALIGFGAVMAVPRLQAAFAGAATRLTGGGNALLARVGGRGGGGGQFVVGLLLGVVWTPCVGPTLGAASTLAAQGRQLGSVAALMLVFGVGAATPLVVLGTLSRRFAGAARGRWVDRAELARRVLGISLVVFGLAIVLGVDKSIESWLVDHSPNALTEWTTRF
jgi:cytochrome c-type biogenesis protein